MNESANETIRVGIAQYAVADAGRDGVHHEEKAIDFISRLGEMNCDVIALPELCTTTYFPAQRDEKAFSLAKKSSDPFIERVARLAFEYQAEILLPIFEEAGDGVYYNSVFHIGRNGDIADRYRKTHVPAVRSFEKYYFRPGSGIEPFQADWGRFGCLLCQDRFFPEASRVLALKGAQIIFLLNASADYARFAETWEPICITRACENGCFVVAVNRCGTEGASRFFGRSMVVGPDGRVLQSANEAEATIVAEIDLNEVRRFRHMLQMYRDYRPELYQAIVSFSDMNDA